MDTWTKWKAQLEWIGDTKILIAWAPGNKIFEKHLGFVRIYDVLYLDHQLSHRVINCYCSYNVCRNLTTTIKIGQKFRHQYQWQALTWGHRPKQKTKFSLQEYKKSTGIRISKVIQCHWMVTIFWSISLTMRLLKGSCTRISKMQNLHMKKNHHGCYRGGLILTQV